MTIAWRKSSRSAKVNDEVCVEVAALQAGAGRANVERPT